MVKQVCSRCKVEKEDSEFNRGNNKLGLHYNCKFCEKNYQLENKERIKQYQKNYREKNKKKRAEYNKKYQKRNREKLNNYHKKYIKDRRLEDTLFKIKGNLRARIYPFIKGIRKKKTEKFLGASFEEVKRHIESTFKEGMS